MEKPAKGTILAPDWTLYSYSGVLSSYGQALDRGYFPRGSRSTMHQDGRAYLGEGGTGGGECPGGAWPDASCARVSSDKPGGSLQHDHGLIWTMFQDFEDGRWDAMGFCVSCTPATLRCSSPTLDCCPMRMRGLSGLENTEAEWK